jgi:DNA invertase Pin-like site-specific DNA recombinase
MSNNLPPLLEVGTLAKHRQEHRRATVICPASLPPLPLFLYRNRSFYIQRVYNDGMKAIGYVRVSTAHQGDSRGGLDAQIASIKAEATRRGYDLEVVEEVESGTKRNRPGLDYARHLLNTGKAAVLICHRLDRLMRGVRDTLDLHADSTKYGWKLVCCDGEIDTTTANGILRFQLNAVFAEHERNLISQRTREALAAKRAQGVQLGRPSALDASVVALVRSYRTQGATLRRIAELLQEQQILTATGNTSWHACTVKLYC